MNCPFCAEEIKDEAILCRFCGKDLLVKSEETASRKKTYGGNQPKTPGFNKKLLLFVSIVVVLILSLFIFVFSGSGIGSLDSSKSDFAERKMAMDQGNVYGQQLAKANQGLRRDYFKIFVSDDPDQLKSAAQWALELCSNNSVSLTGLENLNNGGLDRYPDGTSDPLYGIFNNACLNSLGYPPVTQ